MYVLAVIKRERRETAYRLYMSEGVKILTQDIARAFGGKQLSVSFGDLIGQKKLETRTANDIISHMKTVIGKAGEM